MAYQQYSSVLLQQPNLNVTVVIDAFRAFSTASYVLSRQPLNYFFTNKCSVISLLAANLIDPITIGKPEIGSSLIYDIPNSPTRTVELSITGRNILHRTEAGATGVLAAKNSDIILAAGFNNASATAKYINRLISPNVTILPMGHEALEPSLEDEICADYIKSLIANQQFEIAHLIDELKSGPGKYFFSEDQWQYPQEDFDRCLQTNLFNFAIRAFVKDDYALLSVCE